MMKLLNVAPDVMIFGEVWVKLLEPFNLYKIPGYTLEKSLREHKSGGGIFVYVKENLGHRLVTTKSLQFEKVKISFKALGEQMSVIAYYRPPEIGNLNSFIVDVESELNAVSGRLVICGDLNIDTNDATSNESIRLLDLLSSYGLRVCNNKPTRDTSNKCIDHFICNFTSDMSIANDTISMPADISDHNMLMTSLKDTSVSRMSGLVTRSFVDYTKISEVFDPPTDMDDVNE